MIDTDKYNIDDDVVWVWKDHSPDEEGWVLWEYRECPAEKGGYTLHYDGKGFDKTYEPWFQVLPALKFQCEIDERMQAIVDLPLIIQEVKRLREALVTVQRLLVWDEKDRAMDGDPITLEALVTQVEQVRSDITEMIE